MRPEAPDEPNGSFSPLFPGRPGRSSFSLQALAERVQAEFHAETAGRRDILAELDTPDKQRAYLAEVVDYVLAVEYLPLPPRDKADIVEAARRELFAFGPLETWLDDDTITEIVIDGPHALRLRHGAGSLTLVPDVFTDTVHLRAILDRLLATVNLSLDDAPPFIETGVVVGKRRARLSRIGPPVTAHETATLRLHPSQPWTLAALVGSESMLPPAALPLLEAIITGGHGLLIAGESGTGKTTLANALLTHLPDSAQIAVAERAAECTLPPHATRHTPAPDSGDFAAPLADALDSGPGWLLVDEVRGDEGAAAWDLLSQPDAPPIIWVLRSTHTPERLLAALKGALHPPASDHDPAALRALIAARLPFVVTLRRTHGRLHVDRIAEWEQSGDDSPLTLRTLLTAQGLTSQPSRHALPLPDGFWQG